MKKILLFLLSAVTFFPATLQAEITPRLLWNNYLNLAQKQSEYSNSALYPGRLLTDSDTEFLSDWKYRKVTYEIHYDDKRTLGRAVYDLALHSGDIPLDTSLSRVESGVEGFHYDINQICLWINDVLTQKRNGITAESCQFIVFLLQDKIIFVENNTVKPNKDINHVLAVAKGKKRSLQQNLLHERLHVYWDEDEVFKKTAQKKWNALSLQEKESANQKLKHYADNAELRLEEWAVREAEQNKILLEKL